MNCWSGSSRSQKQDLESGSKENRQDLLNIYKDNDKENWKTIRWSLLLLLNLVAASLDPLFFYIPTINDELKCLRPDRNLGITAISLRFCGDILQLLLWLHCNEEQLLKNVSSFLARTCLRSNRQSSDSTAAAVEVDRSFSSTDTTSQRKKNTARVIQLVSILPLPQVATIIIIAMDGCTKSPHAVTLLKFCVLSQFVIRAIRVYPSYENATRKSPTLLRGRIWVGAAFNLLLFVIVGHVLGAFWYLLSVGRNMDCWTRACESHAWCDVSTLYCIRSSGDKTYLNQSCPIETSDNPPFDFGIYLPALQSNIVSSSDFSLKLAYCVWWGLRNLSSFAQNLTTSAYKWEICFAISISIFGLILFSLLIGNMQAYLQCLTNKEIKDIKKMEEQRDKVKENFNVLFKWMPFWQLHMDLKVQTIWYEDPKWLKNKGVDLKGILNTIAPDLSLQIKEKLCLPLLSKVPLFGKLDDQPLKMLCGRAKPEIFLKNSYLFHADSQIKEVILIVCGEVWSYPKEDGESDVSSQKLTVKYLGPVGLDPKDLDPEDLDRDLSSKPLSSSVALRNFKAVTKVEAFVLTVEDLSEVWSKFEGCLYKSQMKKCAESTKGEGQMRRRRHMKVQKGSARDAQANNSPRMQQANM